ncbi:MAG: hypothetical protein ABI639_12970 [Thermoanaerobaculia bacterium]
MPDRLHPDKAGCAKSCVDDFVSARYRQFSRAHSDCLLAEGPASAHARMAAATAWGKTHGVTGTPTVYVGHPRIGFRDPGDAEDFTTYLKVIRSTLAEARKRLAAPPAN